MAKTPHMMSLLKFLTIIAPFENNFKGKKSFFLTQNLKNVKGF